MTNVQYQNHSGPVPIPACPQQPELPLTGNEHSVSAVCQTATIVTCIAISNGSRVQRVTGAEKGN